MTHALELRIVFALDNKRVACDRKKLRLACAQQFFGDRTLITLPLCRSLSHLHPLWTDVRQLFDKEVLFYQKCLIVLLDMRGRISSKPKNEDLGVSKFDFYWSFQFLITAIKSTIWYKVCSEWNERFTPSVACITNEAHHSRGSLNFTIRNEV